MAAAFCAVCGTKNKDARLRCVRCGRLLDAAASPAARRSFLAQYRGLLVLAGACVPLAALVAAVANPQPSESARPAVKASSAQPLPAAAVSAAPAPIRRGLVEAKSDGTAAYAAGDYAAALESYRRAVELNPEDGEAQNNLGQVLARAGQPAEAIPHLQKAVQLYPNVWAYRFNLAHAHGLVGNWSQAVEDYRRARDLFPDDYVTHFNLGMALHRLGDEQAAVGEFLKGAELAPAEPSFHFSLGISLERLNRTEEAAKAYEQYLELAPAAADAEKVKARIEHLRRPA